MNYFDAAILGIIQGLTEFLPVSSSGHLVLGEAILKVKEPGVTFEVVVHIGTLVSVLYYFREKLGRLVRAIFDSSLAAERKMIGYLIIGTIPAGLAGVLLEDFFERRFSEPALTSGFLLVTGLILLSTRWCRPGSRPIRFGSALTVGLGQALAILPGVSRSGTTISTGLWAGVEPSAAAEFSFLLSIPAVAGAAVLKSREMVSLNHGLLGPYLVGTLLSFVFGLAAVHLVMKIVKRGKLEYFAYYCFAAGLFGLYIFLT